MNDKKIIFLDIDGVLNCSKSKVDKSVGYLGIDDDKLERLKRIVKETNAEIVLVSSWKEDWFSDLSWKYMQRSLGNLIDKKMLTANLKIIDKTDDETYNRGEGINNYLKKNPTDNFIILDDEDFDYEEQKLLDHLIHTDFYNFGLTEDLTNKAIHKLNHKEARYKCIGAIVGDISGSGFEFTFKAKDNNYELLNKDSCHFTDDTVMTIAVMDYFVRNKVKPLPYYFKKWFRKYPFAGYGYNFANWCNSYNDKPYNSFGNGSAMRVSPVVYVAKDLDECLKLAKETAETTHNHPEGIKGAQAIAGCAFIAKKGFKKDIYEFAKKFYPQIDTFDLEELHRNYEFDVTCQGSVPIAIYAFLTSKSFEDCLRIVNYIGGDTDTIGAMAGAISELYYKIESEVENKTLSFLTLEIVNVIEKFNNVINK